MLGNDVYVDDLVTGADTLEDAMRICKEAECILQMAGMNPRKWKSNDPNLAEKWSGELGGEHGISAQAVTKILGVEWRPITDEFTFEMSSLIDFLRQRHDTKRFPSTSDGSHI